MPDFEVYDRKSKPVGKEPLVTLQARGSFSFNEAAYELLGRPGEVELLYSKEDKIVGFQPAEDSPSAYPIHRQTNGRTYQTGGQAFCNFYGIETGKARRYEARDYEGIVGIDLKEEAIEARRTAIRFIR